MPFFRQLERHPTRQRVPIAREYGVPVPSPSSQVGVGSSFTLSSG